MDKSVGPITMSGPGWTEKVAFRSMRINEALSEPFLYEAELLTEEARLEPGDVLGQALTVSVQVGDEKRHYNSVVVSMLRLGTEGRYFLYRLVLRPWLWLLSRTSNSRIHKDKSIIDIVRDVCNEHGFSDVELKLDKAYPTLEYVTQYRETDLNFIRRLLEREGVYFYFRHTDSTHFLVLCDSSAKHTPTIFHESVRFLPPGGRIEGLLPYISAWHVQHDVQAGAYALKDYDFEDPGAHLKVKQELPAAHPHGSYEMFDYPGGYVKPKPGEDYAELRLEELHSEQTRMEGRTNARGILVGSTLQLEQHPVKDHNGEYLIVSLSGMLGSHGLEAGAGFDGDVFSGGFTAIDSKHQFRPQRKTPQPIIHGAQTAKVVGERGQEITTDKYGRVKLQFHWDRYSPGDQTSSAWVRVAQVWAGERFGAMHVPRIGHEVLVEFLEGDPDQPIIVGRVYNKDNMPPYALPKNQTQSGIKSRSSKGGTQDNFNEIRFEDKKGEEEFFMQAEKDQNINVKNNRSATVGAGDSVSVGASRSVNVTANLSTSVGTGGDSKNTLTVTGDQEETISKTLTITAGQKITIQIEGGSKLVMTKDSITFDSGTGSHFKMDPTCLLRSNAKSSLLLTDNVAIGAKTGSSIAMSADVTASSKGGSSMTLDGDASLDSSKGNANITGAVNVAATAAKKGGSLTLDSASATLSGTKVSVNGTTTAEVRGPVVKIN